MADEWFQMALFFRFPDWLQRIDTFIKDSIEPGNHAVGLFGAFVSRWPESFIVTYIHLCSLPIIPISGGQRRQKGRGYINGIEPQSIQSQKGLVPSAFRIFKPFLIELV